jgi:hypothetical protein
VEQSKVRRVLLVSVGLVLFGIVVLIVIAFAQKSGTESSMSATATPETTSSPTTTQDQRPSTGTTSPSPESENPDSIPTVDSLAAVGAAANATDVLAAAQFLPAANVQVVVDRLVYAPQRMAVLDAFLQAGPRIAEAWGYSSNEDANNAAAYEVSVKSYKLLEHDENVASVALYVVTHWITASGYEYGRPGITIVNVRNVDGEWLYESTTSPPSDEVPSLDPSLSLAQTEDLYLPYLTDFKEFENYGDD